MERSDEQLMQSFQAGDQQAFTDLYNRYYKALRRYLRYRIKWDENAAEDVVQAVFIRVDKHRDSFQTGQSFRPWLYAMADRLAKNSVRDRARRMKHVVSFTDFDRTRESPCENPTHSNRGQWSVTEILQDLSESDQEAKDRSEALSNVQNLVRDLPTELRQIVQFVLTNGASLRRAEAILGVGRRTLGRRLDEACRIIRHRLDNDESQDHQYTQKDIQEGTIRDLIDTLPDNEYESLNRIVFLEAGTDEDFSVFTRVLKNLLGLVSTEPALV